MKATPIFARSTLTLLCIFATLALPLAADEEPDGGTPPPEDVLTPEEVSAAEIANRQDPVDGEALNAAIEEVNDKVQMSAPMEAETVSGTDPVIEALDQGLIIRVTLEEVEAAIAAAAATPDPEDDLRAMELKHWGSYRFFLDNPAASPPPDETPDDQQPPPQN